MNNSGSLPGARHQRGQVLLLAAGFGGIDVSEAPVRATTKAARAWHCEKPARMHSPWHAWEADVVRAE